MALAKSFYLNYKERVFPRIKDVRGSHRLLILLKSLASRGIEKIDSEPESIFEAGEWDNLIILDACRHDLYEEARGEDTSSRLSLGSTTSEYIERTFSEGEFDDIIYVSANPFFSDTFLEKLVGKSDLFEAKFDVFNEAWDDEEGTVLPEDVFERAETAKKLFPDKRLIIHFIQPHYPFLDFEYGDGFSDSEGWLGDSSLSVWDLAERGELEKEKVWQGYRRNLEKVLPYAQKIAEEFDGKTVITSDHGNLVGEKGLYGHPDGMDLKPLRKVPWEVIE